MSKERSAVGSPPLLSYTYARAENEDTNKKKRKEKFKTGSLDVFSHKSNRRVDQGGEGEEEYKRKCLSRNCAARATR